MMPTMTAMMKTMTKIWTFWQILMLALPAKRIGVSKTGDWGFVGMSVSDTENLFGVPFHGEGHEDHGAADALNDDHDDDDHDDDHDDGHDDHAGEGHDEHEGERIFSKTDSTVVNLEGSYVTGNSWLTKIDYHFRDSDYSHTEQHAEEEGHEGEGHAEGGHHEEGPTTFTNDAKEYGVIFDLANDSLSQKVAVNYVVEDVSVIGDEAFINPTESKELTLGYYLSKDFDQFHIDFGIRHDQISRKGSVSHAD